ncbi:hypothetical protein GCM10009528_34100 [Kineococcus aurantiacus]
MGPARGDAAGLAALAGRLHRAAALVAAPEQDAVRAAATAVDDAAQRLRDLPAPVPAGAVTEVEVALARALAGPLAVLVPGRNH